MKFLDLNSFFFPLNFIRVWLIYSVVLVSGIQQSDSVIHAAAAVAAKSLQSCLTLCDPIDSSPPGSPIPGILQARTLEWVAISFSNVWKWSAQSCLTLSDLMDCSLLGSSVHGIFQASVLEWVAIAFSGSVIHIFILFQILFTYRLLHNIK